LPPQVADPLRHFVDGLLSLTNPIGSVGDKVNVGVFRYGQHGSWHMTSAGASCLAKADYVLQAFS
jgi:hypothetical protein